jgi:hypothetical protein
LPTLQLRELLSVLLRGEVEFVVVGGVAAIAHGASTMTRDVDVVAPLTVENCARILEALKPFEPRFYQAVNRPRVERSAAELAEFKNLYFETTLGIIDILGSLPPLGRYEDVAARAETHPFLGMGCRILCLDDLIAVKAHVGRPKDRLAEVELRAIRDLRKGR